MEYQALIFCAAALLFVANFALGLLVQFGGVDTGPFRWLNHAPFLAVFAAVALATILSLRYRVRIPALGGLIRGIPGSP